MTEFRIVAPDFAVAPQLKAEDFAEAAKAGYVKVINNRPDGEAGDQLPNAAAAAQAKAAGLQFAHIPIAGPPGDAEIEALARELAAGSGPILAYCRSGTRSVTLWALAQARRAAMPADAIVAAAAGAGYDLSGLRPRLVSLAGG